MTLADLFSNAFFTSLIDACYKAVDTMWNIVRVFNCPHRFYFCSAFKLAVLVAALKEHGTEGGSLLCHERKRPHLTLKFKSGLRVFYKVILFICLWIERMNWYWVFTAGCGKTLKTSVLIYFLSECCTFMTLHLLGDYLWLVLLMFLPYLNELP